MKLRKMLAMVLTVAMIVSLLPVMAVTAATTSTGSGAGTSPVVFTKELIPAGNGQPAKIKLEAYVEGTVSSTSGGKPTDIILVLLDGKEAINVLTVIYIVR